MSSIYKSERVDLKDKNWEKRMEEIIKRKISKVMKEKGLFGPNDVVIEPPITKEILEYPNPEKLKPSSIDSYDDTRDLVDHIQTF